MKFRIFGHTGVTERHVEAYARGYYWGRSVGREEEQPKNPNASLEHYFYRLGYDAGVTAYTRDAHPEEVDT